MATSLLDGQLLEGARRAIDAILSDLDRTRASLRDPTLAFGHAGLAITQQHFAVARGEPERNTLAAAHLEAAIDTLAHEPLLPGLFHGFTGIAWAAERLRRGRGPDPCASLDDALLTYLATLPRAAPLDIIVGSAGLGFYALNRQATPRGRALFRGVLGHLEAQLERAADGTGGWRSVPEVLTPRERQRCPAGNFNLGVAHGTPGMVLMLARALAEEVEPERCRALLEASVPWLLARQLPSGGFARYEAPGVGPDAVVVEARSAWCYGAPGVSIALLRAARAASNGDWERAALLAACRAATRDPAEGGVVDGGLCHGAAGLGHIFAVLYRETGDPAMLEACRAWFERLLAMRRDEEGIGGFARFDDYIEEWSDEPGLYDGAAGIALALSDALGAEADGWDGFLGLAPPRRRERAT